MHQQRAYQFDAFRINPETFTLYRNGEAIHLEPRVLRLLIYLIENRDRLVPREELVDNVWGDTVISDSALSQAVARLRKALDDDAAAPRFIETLHSLGYHFIADLDEVPHKAVTSAEHDVSNGPGRKITGTLAVAVAIAAIVSVIMFWPKAPEPGTEPVRQIASLAVLPLGNLTGDPGQDDYVDGLHDLLTTEIARRSALPVTSRQSTRRFRDSDKPLGEIARQLGVEALVEGSVLTASNQLRMTTQLIDARGDVHLWANTYQEDERNLMRLVEEAAIDIVAHTQGKTTAQPADRTNPMPVDPAASRAFLNGLAQLNRLNPEGFRRAHEYMQQTISLEPELALAWSNLAAVHILKAVYGFEPPRKAIQQARAAASRALELDHRGFGNTMMGWVQLWNYDRAGAAKSFRLALEDNPSDTAALHGESDCLLLAGQLEESLARLRKGQMIGPFSPLANMPVPIHLYLMRRYEEAIGEARAVNQRIPTYSIHWLLARIYWQQGRFEEALDEERQDLVLHGDDALLAALERGYASGDALMAMHALAEAQIEKAGIRYVDPFRIAISFARAGDHNEAFKWLGRAVENGSPKLTYLEFWPELDAMRDDPRFVELRQLVSSP